MDDVMETPNSEDPYREYSLVAVLRIDQAMVIAFIKCCGQSLITSTRFTFENFRLEIAHNKKNRSLIESLTTANRALTN